GTSATSPPAQPPTGRSWRTPVGSRRVRHAVFRWDNAQDLRHNPTNEHRREEIMSAVSARARTAWCVAALMSAAAVWTAGAQAQSYPSQPVTIVVPLAAGSGMDSIVRLYADPLSQAL